MATNIKEDVFVGTDNTFTIKVYDEFGVAIDFDLVTRMKLWLGSACTYLIDSDTYPNAFNWTTPTVNETGVTEFALGAAVADLKIPANSYKTRWKVYSPLQPNGIVVADAASRTSRLTVRVLSSCETV